MPALTRTMCHPSAAVPLGENPDVVIRGHTCGPHQRVEPNHGERQSRSATEVICRPRGARHPQAPEADDLVVVELLAVQDDALRLVLAGLYELGR